MIGVLLGAARYQLLAFRHSPESLMALVNAPLLTVAFLSIMRHADRPDLEAYAVLAPAVITVWQMALLVSGEIIDFERHNGSLEALIAAPAPMGAMILGRVLTVTAVSLLSLVESAAVARLLFGVAPDLAHPGVFAAALGATALAMAGTAVAMAAVFVLHRSARTFQNSLSYPFYLLGGAMVPPVFLPEWLQPLSRAVFLSWSTDLFRDSLRAAPVPAVAWRIGMVLLLGAAAYGLGVWLLDRVLERVRRTGEVGYA